MDGGRRVARELLGWLKFRSNVTVSDVHLNPMKKPLGGWGLIDLEEERHVYKV